MAGSKERDNMGWVICRCLS